MSHQLLISRSESHVAFLVCRHSQSGISMTSPEPGAGSTRGGGGLGLYCLATQGPGLTRTGAHQRNKEELSVDLAVMGTSVGKTCCRA
eukprot:scaffold19362_cov86-Isochrysis_galbana.AAC.3